MEEAEGEWGKYALESVYSREEAEQRYRYWKQRAAEIPGTDVKVISLKDPLGGESFVFCTETLELVPAHWRMSHRQVRERLDELKRTSSPEDADAIALLEGLLCPDSRSSQDSFDHRGGRVDEIARLEKEVDELRSRLRGIEDDLRRKPPGEG